MKYLQIFGCIVLFAIFINPLQGSGKDTHSRESLLQTIESMQTSTNRLAVSTDFGGKCGLRLSLELLAHWGEFSASEQATLSKYLSPSDRQKDRIIGKFRFFYDTTGVSVPALLGPGNTPIPNSYEAYIDSAGVIFNHVWDYEISVLGYLAPPLKPDATYWVEIQELGFGLYGRTVPDTLSFGSNPAPKYDSYIEIDNDFRGYFSNGIAGLKVTAAHEFHHAIQLGGYGSWGTIDYYFLEITSTWMEDVVYSDVNDYYQYLTSIPRIPENSQFAYPDFRFTEGNGSIEYSRAVWGKFIEKRFSPALMLRIWEHMKQTNALPAIDRALREVGSSFGEAFSEWAVWNGNTGPLSDTVRYYEEGRHYPLIRMRPVITYAPPQRTIVDSTQAQGSVYVPVMINGVRMVAIISNLDQQSVSTRKRFSYVLQDTELSGSRHLSNGVYARLDVNDPMNWSVFETVPSIVSDVVVYPNPYRPRGWNPLAFRLPPVVGTMATLSIFSSSFKKIHGSDEPVLEIRASEPVVRWDGDDENGNFAPTGIYFFVLTIDGRQYSGKFAVVRE